LSHSTTHEPTAPFDGARRLQTEAWSLRDAFFWLSARLVREQFCEDIPPWPDDRRLDPDEALRDLPITVRISRGEDNGPQRGAQSIRCERTYPGGSIVLEYSFDTPGNFIVRSLWPTRALSRSFHHRGRSTNWPSKLAMGGGLLILTNFALTFIFIRPKTIREGVVHERFGEAMR